ncbi:TetR/AcrR family transcriptional regulator [Actinosynnema sp. CA-248983]
MPAPQNTERRARLLEAAVEVLATQGAHGLSHRAVDRRAGVPLDTAKNYFPTRDDLFEGLGQHVLTQRLGEVSAFTDGRADLTFADLAWHYFRIVLTTRRARAVAIVELFLEAQRRPALRDLVGTHLRANLEAIADTIRAGGQRVELSQVAVLDAAFRGLTLLVLSISPQVAGDIGLDDLESTVRQLADRLLPP